MERLQFHAFLIHQKIDNITARKRCQIIAKTNSNQCTHLSGGTPPKQQPPKPIQPFLLLLPLKSFTPSANGLRRRHPTRLIHAFIRVKIPGLHTEHDLTNAGILVSINARYFRSNQKKKAPQRFHLPLSEHPFPCF
jgi:hypothetical protein